LAYAGPIAANLGQEDAVSQRQGVVLDRVMIGLAACWGVGSLVLFAWDSRPPFVPFGWPSPRALAWDALLSFGFFVQHSGMVRRSFRARLASVVPARYDGAVYAIASGVALTLVVVFWQHADAPVFTLTGVARSLAAGCALLAAVAFVWIVVALRRTIDLLGLRPIRAHLRGRVPKPSPFVVRGPYRWVRHPLYAGVLVLLWVRPAMDADAFLLAVLLSAWILAGTFLEERDLEQDFGDQYRRYKRQVPRLIPWRGRVDVRVEEAGSPS
jgi:protein-S-isoprenylcysteine O-methyltransferase Ste14